MTEEFLLSTTNITDEEKVRRLAHCTFAVGSSEKRFINRQCEPARKAGTLNLTERQQVWLDKIFYRYRKQLERIK
jgi:hypothetical protein